MTVSKDERALCARLIAGAGPIDAGMIAAARRHRVHLLLAESAAPGECTDDETRALKHTVAVAAALDAWSAREMAVLLRAFAGAGVDTIVFKGAAVAYTIYREPYLRPRVDTDLLIPYASRERADRVLADLGWRRPAEMDSELAAAQRHYVKRSGNIDAHVDLHWKIANPRVFAEAISFEELRSRAVPVPALGDAARATGAVDALLLACVHRVAHHGDAIDLIWLWDIHLLIHRLSAGERAAFAALARRTSMTSVSRRGIALAADLFHTPGAADLAGALEPSSRDAEASARFIGGVTPVEVLREDLAALRGWRSKARLISEHLFPSVAYMRSRYPRWPSVLLPLAYAARIAGGAPKWLRRS